jgi:adenylate cyclase
MSMAVYFLNKTQKESVISATDRIVYLNTETLVTTLQNIMLDGKAPLLVKTLTDLKAISEYKEVAIYRIDGLPAFSDYHTLEDVNRRQKKIRFARTERMKDERPENERLATKRHILATLEKQIPVIQLDEKKKEIDYYFPIDNQTDCMVCHGSDHAARGIIHYRLSMAGAYRQIDRNRNTLLIFFAIVGTVLAILLIVVLRRMIVNPLLKIGHSVNLFSSGDFKVRVGFRGRDELGDLADRINIMFKGLDERFRLAKYVSSSTIDYIEKQEEVTRRPEKKHLTILFSDIRDFTSFSEANPIEMVIEHLNTALQAQSEVVSRFGGDIDKFVGDEIMAVFGDASSAVFCAQAMIEAMQASESSHHTGLQVGIGINSGEVMAGHIGSDRRMEYAVIGDTVNVAARLCSLAEAGTILISEAVYLDVRDKVEADLLAGKQLKGKKDAIDVYLVRSVRDNPDA